MSGGQRHSRSLAFLALALAVTVAACGGGGGGSIVPRPPSPLAITTTSLPNGARNQAYNQTLQATGGTGARTWSVSAGSLPAGLSLNSSTGTISGTPFEGGTFSFTVQVRDSSSPQHSDTQGFTVLFLSINTGPPDGVENEPYNASLGVIGEVGAVTWGEPTSFFSETTGTGAPGTPCEGLTLSFSAGTIAGTPINPGLCGPFTARATDSDSPPRTTELTLDIQVESHLVITTTSLPPATTGVPYNQAINVTGGTTPYIWSEPTASFNDAGEGEAGTPCEALRLDLAATASTTRISGTPMNPGACAFTIRADNDSPPQFDEQALSVTVNPGPVVITTTSFPSGAVNRTYSAGATASGGTPPFTWSEPTVSFDAGGIGAPATPCEGLTLFSTGIISGIPAVQGTCGPFTLQVNDSGAQSDSQTGLSILIGPEPAGRNDTIANATPLSNGSFLASISPFTDPNNPSPDTDFYRLTANAGATVTVEVFARRRVPPSKLDSVVEIVNSSGVRFNTCREGGDGSTTGGISGVDGSEDPTWALFDDACINDDLELGLNRDSKIEFQVPGSGTVTFFVHVLDWRGDARPDFLYELTITGAN